MSKVLSENSNIAHKVLFHGGLQPVLAMDFHHPEVNFYSHRDGGMVLISSPADFHRHIGIFYTPAYVHHQGKYKIDF